MKTGQDIDSELISGSCSTGLAPSEPVYAPQVWQPLVDGACSMMPGVQFWGGGFMTGGDQDHVEPYPHYTTSASECAQSCASNPQCKTFVYLVGSQDCYRHSADYTGERVHWDVVSGNCTQGLPIPPHHPALPSGQAISDGLCQLWPGTRGWGGGFVTGGPTDHIQPYPASTTTPLECARFCAATPSCRTFVHIPAAAACFMRVKLRQ